MKLTILSQYFYPELISTGQLLTELAEELILKNVEINVLCGQPTYYDNKKVDKYINHNGIKIKRINNIQLSKNSKLGKILNSLTFFLGILIDLIFSKDKSPILIVTNPPFLPFVGYLVNKIKKRKYYVLIHDIYPDIAAKLGYLQLNSLIVKVWHFVNKLVFDNAEKIIVLGRDMHNIIKNKHVNENSIVIIENWSNGEIIRPLPKKDNDFINDNHLSGKFIVMYSGNMGLFHDMESIIEAAEILKEKKDILFVFIGGGGKLRMIQEYAENNNLNNVRFFQYQPKENLKFTLTAADLALVTLENGIEGLAVPSKLYGVMAAGVPIVANVPFNSEVAYVINESKSGKVVPVKNPKLIADSILEFYENKDLLNRARSNAREEFENKYSIDRIADKYYRVIFGT